MKATTYVCNFVAQFAEDNWDKVDTEYVEIKQSKTEFIKVLKTNIDTAIWFLAEVMNWGMDKNYFNELCVDTLEEYDFYVLKLNDKYVKLTYTFSESDVEFTEPKEKTIIYFE